LPTASAGAAFDHENSRLPPVRLSKIARYVPAVQVAVTPGPNSPPV
jgi:hypothetical protein